MSILVTAAALSLVGAAQAQTPPAQATPAPSPPARTASPPSGPGSPATALTSELNRAPAAPTSPLPAPAVTPAPRAATPVVPPTAVPAVVPRAGPTPVPTPPPAVSTAPRPVLPPPEVGAPPGAVTAPRPEPSLPVTASAAAALPGPATVATTPPPATPAVTVLDSAARAALPFTVQLPPGFEIVTGRPGPDFRIYTIRRGEQSFVMVYAGPSSQFPIYTGQMVEVGGRATVIATEDGVRHAIEHLFQRSTAPTEIHIWAMSLDGADRAMAEQIAQSVDVR